MNERPMSNLADRRTQSCLVLGNGEAMIALALGSLIHAGTLDD